MSRGPNQRGEAVAVPPGPDLEPTSVPLVLGAELYRAVLDASDDAISIIDPETGRYLYANKNLREKMGFTEEEVATLHLGRMSAGDPADAHIQSLARVRKAAASEPQRFEWDGKDTKGRPLAIEVSLRALAYDGRTLVISVVRSIEERRKAEKALRASERRFRTFFERSNLGMGIGHFGDPEAPDQFQMELNPALQVFFGTQTAVQGLQDVLDSTHPDDLQEDLRLYGELIRRILGATVV